MLSPSLRFKIHYDLYGPFREVSDFYEKRLSSLGYESELSIIYHRDGFETAFFEYGYVKQIGKERHVMEPSFHCMRLEDFNDFKGCLLFHIKNKYFATKDELEEYL